MAWYMGRYRVSQTWIEEFMSKPKDRTKVIAALMKAFGGKLHHYFFSHGEYDVVLIFEAGDNAQAVTTALVAAASGGITGAHTTPLLTMDEMIASTQKAAKIASKYKLPSAA